MVKKKYLDLYLIDCMVFIWIKGIIYSNENEFTMIYLSDIKSLNQRFTLAHGFFFFFKPVKRKLLYTEWSFFVAFTCK